MIWVNKKKNGERIVFQKEGSILKSMKINKENTQSFDMIVSRAKKWFSKNNEEINERNG
jgi:hypothetical protein|tara:strand:- start:449 stop:625 length:177 start_codon:yes stop_codon:yes gene_type:complete